MLQEKIILSLENIFPDIDNDFKHVFLEMLNWTSEELINSSQITLKKPYGYNYIIKHKGLYGLSYVCFDPQKRTSIHLHNQRTEFFYVRKGQLTLLSNGEEKILNSGEAGCSTPNIPHSLINASQNNALEILEIFSPSLLNDKVRVIDFYNRRIGNVEYKE